MARVVLADGALVDRVITAAPLAERRGLSRDAFTKYDAALAKTTWGLQHRRRYALMEDDTVLATAERYDLTGMLDRERVTICGIASAHSVGHDAGDHSGALIARLLEDVTREGADLALLFRAAHTSAPVPEGFAEVPLQDVTLLVTESPRYGAPMTLVRVGEDRDLNAIAAMGQIRASEVPFCLDRDTDFIKHAITRTRLLAGLGTLGARQLIFVIAEEGVTAAAYLVISVTAGAWTIEECGDRDPSGARVGALLQALIAREPSEARPVIRGWLPPGFLPPQVTITSTAPAPSQLLVCALSSRVQGRQLTTADVLYWRNDMF